MAGLGLSAVITGGRSGIGQRLAELMAADGWQVFATGRYASRNTQDSGVHSRPADVRHPHVFEEVIREAAEAARLTVLVNCAGVVYPHPLAELDSVEALQEIATNFAGAVLSTSTFLRYSSGRRAVVMMASSSGLRPSPGWAVYGATKAAMISLGASVAAENPDVNVITVCPGRTATALRAVMVPDEDPSSIMQPEAVAAFTLGHIDCALTAEGSGDQLYLGEPLPISGVI